jgi:hypothetical protein
LRRAQQQPVSALLAKKPNTFFLERLEEHSPEKLFYWIVLNRKLQHWVYRKVPENIIIDLYCRLQNQRNILMPFQKIRHK